MVTKPDKTITVKGPLAFLVVLLVIGLIFARALFAAWVAMLLLGALHHSVSDSVPALSYWATFLVILAVSFVAGLFGKSSK